MKKTKKLIALFAALALSASCFVFTACPEGNDKEEENETEHENTEIVLTKDTDFDALVSEKVDEDGWEKAFSAENYYNSTLKYLSGHTCAYILTSTDGDDRFSAYYDVDEIDMSLEEIKANSTLNFFWAKYADTGIIENYEREYNSETELYDGEFKKTTCGPDDEYYEDWCDSFEIYSHIILTPDCSQFYSKFAYNEEINAYEFNDGIIATNGIGEYWEHNFIHIVVKIINGKLAYMYCENDNESKAHIYFYDFGTTEEVTLPEVDD